MQVIMSFKTPDVLFYALQDVPEDIRNETKEELEKYIRYGENLQLAYDTETKNFKVLT